MTIVASLAMTSSAALSAADLRAVIATYGELLRAHKEVINRLNVYPVPDGDTGTNMTLTIESVMEELNALDDALSDYQGIETEQSDEQSDATQARLDLEQLVDQIAAQRLKIQFAVDGLWPAAKKENAAIRVEFGLPADRAFKG